MGEIWQQFQTLIFEALRYFEGITNDWGMAIILLTLAVRLILLPLTWKQTKSMVEMQRVQPLLKSLQEKYKDDKEKLQEETLKLYSENKVNPFGGCLPLLLQFPVLIALYQVLGGTPAKPGHMMKFLAANNEVGSFFQIIPNISLTPQQVWNSHNYLMFVPYILLVLLFAVSIWLPQALMPGDKQQKMIGGYMAIVMLYFGWVSPAGVLLYWDVSSIFGLVQQQVTMSVTKRELAQRDADAAALKAAEKEAKKKNSGSAAEQVADKKAANKGSKKSRQS